MSTVLAISSQVVRGHVGNSAAAFALQRLGHEVWMLPTVVLSNHPGHPHVAGTRIEPDILGKMFAALEHNGWLDEVGAVLTGYLPTAEHVAVAANVIARLRKNGGPKYVLVDPVLGDDPKGLYLAESAAEAVRDRLLPMADILTPNRFELAWLSGRPATDAPSATIAADSLGVPCILITSVPAPHPDRLTNLLWQKETITTLDVPRLSDVPHGTGDFLSALLLGHMLQGKSPDAAMPLAVNGVAAAIAASVGADELRLVQSQGAWACGA